jgi:hypothetical protein
MSFEIGMLYVVIAAYVVISAFVSGILLCGGIYGPERFSSAVAGGLLWPVGLLLGLLYSAKEWRNERRLSKRKGEE